MLIKGDTYILQHVQFYEMLVAITAMSEAHWLGYIPGNGPKRSQLVSTAKHTQKINKTQ